jgi:hypothetical protein
LIQGGKQVGVDIPARFPGLIKSQGQWSMSPEALSYQMGLASYAVEQAGGDPYGGSPRDAAKALRKAADALDKMKQGNGGGGQPAPTRPPMNLPNGGGNNPGRP